MKETQRQCSTEMYMEAKKKQERVYGRDDETRLSM